MTELQFLDKYQPLIAPNHTPEESARLDSPEYRQGLIRRLLSGEEIDPSEFGAGNIIGKWGRSTGKTTHNEMANAQDSTKGRGDVWY